MNIGGTSSSVVGSSIAATLTLSNTSSLTVSGDVNIYRSNASGILHTIGIGANTLTVNGNMYIGSGTATGNNRPSSVTISTGTLDIAGNLTYSYTGTTNTGAQIVFSGAGNLYIGGNYVLSGTVGIFTPSTGTVTFDGTNQSIATASYVTYYNLNLSNSGTKTLTGTSTTLATIAGGTMAIDSGVTLATANLGVSLEGSFTNAGTALNAGSSAIVIAGTGTQSIAGFTTTGLVSMTKTAGTATFAGNVSGAGLTMNGNGGTLNLGTGLTHTFSGTWTRTYGTLNGGSSLLRLGASSSGNGGTFTAGTGTVEFYLAGAQTVASTATTFNNLILSGSGVKTTTNVTVTGTLYRRGTCTVSATPTYSGSAQLVYDGTDAITSGTTEWPATMAYPVTVSNTAGVTLSAAKVINANLAITSGGILNTSTSNYQVSFGSNFTNAGTFTANASPIVISGTAAQSIAGFSTTGLVSMTKTGGTATLAGNVSGAGLTLSGNGGTLDLGSGYTHTFSGNWIRTNGTLIAGSCTLRIGGTVTNTAGAFTANTSTVEYYASAAQTIATVTYNNLTLSGTSAKTITGATVNGIFSIEGAASTTGTVLTYGASSSLRYNGTGVQTVGIEWNSTFARPITILNTNGVTLNASKTSYTGTLTNNGLLNTQNYQLTGTVSNNGTIAAARTDIMSSGTLTNSTGSTINYTTPLSIPASTGYYNLTLSASGTYTLAGNVTGINILTLTTATTYLQTAGYTLGYVTLAGLGSILTPQVTLSSTNPAVAAALLEQSSVNSPVYKFTLLPNFGVNLTGLSFTTTGSYDATDLANFKLLTNTTDTFSGATQVGTTLSTGLGAGTHSFAAFTQALTASATSYFWITTDLSASAVSGNSFTVSALTTSDITVSTGSKTGTAYAGGTQTIMTSLIALSSANPAVIAANIGQGSTNNVFYAFSTAVTGALTTLNSVAFTTAGTAVVTTDLSNFKLWYSTSNSYASAAQIGTSITTLLSEGTHTFTGLTQAINAGATGYFWITADLAAAATVNRTLYVSPAINTSNLSFANGSKSGTAYAGGTQTIVAVVTTLASANPAVTAANIGIGTLNKPIYRFTLSPTVNVNMTGLNFVANGTYVAADITNFKIWSSTTDDLTTATQVGTSLTTIAASGSQQTFAAFTQALSGSTLRYFWITTDLTTAATAAHTITVAALTTARVTTSPVGTKTGTAYIGGTQTITAGIITLSSANPALPAGNLVQGALKIPVYQFALARDAATGTVNLTGLTFTTASGSYVAGDISKFQLWYSTFNDINSGAWVGGDITTTLGNATHTFGTFTTGVPVVESTTDYFWITVDVNSAAVIGHTLIVSAITTANLTLSGGNKAGTAYAGAAQTVSGPVTTIDSVEPAIEASVLAQSNLKRPLARFTLSTDGLVNVTAINFTSSGDYSAADITKFQLWTGIVDDLTGAGQIGGDITTSLGSGSHTFSSFTLALSHEEEQYFWITTDAAASATLGKKISVDALGTSDFTVSVGSKTGSATQGGEQTFCAPKTWLYAIGQPVGPLVGAGTGYQLRVTVHYGSGTNSGEHVYLDGKCRSDFGDIRFFEGPSELDYWIESMTRYDKAVIWVEISGDISINAIPFSIRFGNSSATTTSNGNNTFLFFDDFNRTDNTFAKWTKHKTLDSSTITIPTGKNYARLAGGIPTGTYGHAVLGSVATYSGLTDGSVEYRLRVGQDAISEVGVRGTYVLNAGTGYKGRIDGRVNYQGGSSILNTPYYAWTWLADAPELFDWPVPGTWYHGTVNAFGTTINLLKDDVLKRSSSLGVITGPGEISLQNHYGPYSDYDWVAVRKYVGGLEPAHGAWIWSPIAYPASAVCHNGFTAHWEAVPGATGYQLDVLEDDGTTIVTGWNSVPVSLDVHRVEIISINHPYKYRIRALFDSDVSLNSNVISVSTTAVFDGITASTTILGLPDRTYVPPVVEDPAFTNNDVTIDPDGITTNDYSLVVTWHPTGYDNLPNIRLVLTVNCSDNTALTGVYNINHGGMGFTPAAAAYRWGGIWYGLSSTFGPDSTIVTIPSLAKGSRGELIIALDDGSGTLPVELSSFLVTVNAYNNVLVQWVTQSETNVSGFRIYRGTTEFVDEALCLDAFIPATNTSQMQMYQFADKEITEPGTYYYWLENLDLDGSNMMHGPATIIFSLGGSSTPTIPVIPGLNSIYPNPFNPSATIQYGVAVKGKVEICIYNLKGQKVRNLVLENKEHGTFSIVWNGKDNNYRQVPSGIYFIRMDAGGKTTLRKVVMSK